MTAPTIDREAAYHKLRLLADSLGLMDERPDDFNDSACFAFSMLPQDIARQIYPEWNQEGEPQKEGEQA